MRDHPALAAGNVAVITGAADGIGRATAQALAARGLHVCLADVREAELVAAASELDDAIAVVTDVSDPEAMIALKDASVDAFGRVDVLMNNAGIGRPTGSWREADNWRTVFDVNLFGVVNGMQAFLPLMLEQGTPGIVINTGSKQGITNPPGNPAYNASKAAVKSVTESLAAELRATEGCQLSAHLMVPGFTYTGMIRAFLDEKPAGAWTPEQAVAFMLESIERGDFYILCPDNDVDRETDNRRMAWAVGDLIENRPALSRWDPDWSDAFETHMKD